MVIEELNAEELSFRPQIEGQTDVDIDSVTKDFIKNIVRYEVDNYVIDDPKTQDPIIVSDEDIDDNIDFLVDVYNENMKIPYLDMNKNLNQMIHTRKILKSNELLLYARKEFAKVDLGMEDEYETNLAALNTEMGDIVNFNKIKEDSVENDKNIKKTDSSKLLIDYLIKMRYGGKNMSQIELIVEKLSYDIERLNESTTIDKDRNIKELRRAINIISKIGDDTNNDWHTFFVDSVVTDKRALNLAKEIDRDYIKASNYIDKIFGPEMLNEFIKKYVTVMKPMPFDFIYSSTFYFYPMLLFYTLAKKIESKMKSNDSRSLIYRGYIIHYMLDDLKDDELNRLTQLFTDIFTAYDDNVALRKKLSTMQKVSK